MAHRRGTGWLFELLPDLFPGGWLTGVEIEVWGLFYEELKQIQSNN